MLLMTERIRSYRKNLPNYVETVFCNFSWKEKEEKFSFPQFFFRRHHHHFILNQRQYCVFKKYILSYKLESYFHYFTVSHQRIFSDLKFLQKLWNLNKKHIVLKSWQNKEKNFIIRSWENGSFSCIIWMRQKEIDICEGCNKTKEMLLWKNIK